MYISETDEVENEMKCIAGIYQVGTHFQVCRCSKDSSDYHSSVLMGLLLLA